MARSETERDAVVVPAFGGDNSVTTIQSLGRRGIHTIAVSRRRTVPSFYSRYCDERVVAPSPNDDLMGYKETLLSLARRPEVKTVVPMREEDTYVLSKYRSEFEDHVATLWPTFETLRTAHDRIRLTEAAEEAGVPTPNTALLDEVDDWERPQIVKSRYSLLAREYVDSAPEDRLVSPPSTKRLEPGVEPDREALCREMGHVPIVQEYLPGSEYSHWALYDRGVEVATGQKQIVRSWDYAGGEGVYREIVDDPQLEATGAALLDHLDWHGLGFPQFVKHRHTGEFTLMEVNTRMWRPSLSCAVRAGGDFPYYYWQLANGASFQLGSVCEAGVGTHSFAGEFAHLHSILRNDDPRRYIDRPSVGGTALETVRSVYDQPHFQYLSLDDPLPFVIDVASSIRGSLKQFIE